MAFRARKVFGTFEKRAPGLTTDTRIVIISIITMINKGLLYLKQSLNAYHLSKLVSSQQRITAAKLRTVSGQNDSAVER